MSRRLQIALWIGSFLSPIISPREASALTAEADMDVSLTITSECLITDLPDMDFGSTGVITADIPATVDLKVQCTDSTSFNIGLDEGGGTGATVAARLLSNTVTYSLYSNGGHTTVWGDTIATNTVASSGTGAEQTFTIYGLVPTQTTPAPGTYTDTVHVTVTY